MQVTLSQLHSALDCLVGKNKIFVPNVSVDIEQSAVNNPLVLALSKYFPIQFIIFYLGVIHLPYSLCLENYD
jgi:hypothetical protein